MGFTSSPGKISWSFGNYGRFVDDLHSKMNEQQIADFNSFQSYVFSELGYPPDKCETLATTLEFLKPRYTDEDVVLRLQDLIKVLRLAHKENQYLRFR